jgi:prepilin-type N-terminal cleavage/methylation domain-containing protein
LREAARVMAALTAKLDSARRCLATERGFSALEMLVSIAIMGVLAATAISTTKSARIQVANAQTDLIGRLRVARMKAITSVSHYSVSVTAANQFKVYGMTFDGTRWNLNSTPAYTVSLPNQVTFATTSVGTRIEFNSRGLLVTPTSLTQLDLKDAFGQTRSVQTWPSGQVNAL